MGHLCRMGTSLVTFVLFCQYVRLEFDLSCLQTNLYNKHQSQVSNILNTTTIVTLNADKLEFKAILQDIINLLSYLGPCCACHLFSSIFYYKSDYKVLWKTFHFLYFSLALHPFFIYMQDLTSQYNILHRISCVSLFFHLGRHGSQGVHLKLAHKP